MQYVVIRTGGKQYKVSTGDLLTLDRIDQTKKSVVFEDVLLAVEDDKVSVGKPSLSGARVTASVIEHKRGDKIRVQRFKAKSRYRKTIGFRADQSVVKIDKIELGSPKTSKDVQEPTKTAKK